MYELTQEEIYQYSIDELVCPYCGHDLEEIGDKLYCENCGLKEI